MALIFLDSFDHYVTADMGKKWTVVSGASITAGQGRRGTAAVRFPNGVSSVEKSLGITQPTLIVGCAMRFTTMPTTAVDWLYIRDTGTTQVDLRLNATGKLQVNRGGTTLGVGTAVLSLNTYYYIELFVTVHPTTGVAKVAVNGVLDINLTNQNTRQTAANQATAVRLGLIQGFALGNCDIDDVYVCDSTGSTHTDFLGDCRVDCLLPTGDGTSQQWTPSTPGTHYTLVDDAAPNTTDYVASATVGQRDTYGMQDLSAMTGTIYGVQLNLAALKSDAGARSLKPLLLSGASEALGTATALSTSQTYTLHVQTTDPATGSAWTEAAINVLQCGAEVA